MKSNSTAKIFHTVKSGRYKGEKVIVIGSDYTVLGCSYLNSPSKFAQDYFNRVFSDELPLKGTVMYTELNGKPLLLSKDELDKNSSKSEAANK